MAKSDPKIIITSDMVSFATRRGGTYTVHRNHPFFDEVKAALQAGNTAQAYRWQAKAVGKTTGGDTSKFRVVGNELEYNGKRFHEAFAEAYLVCKDHGAGHDAMNLFFANLDENPNPISVHAFTSFMAKTRMPITDRGTFLAYKRVNSEFRDHHTRRFDNRPGCVLKMDRKDVDQVQSNTCSTGFHVCSHTYLSSFSPGPDLVVEINPKDVVAVPPDYNLSKMRLSEYRVLCTLPYFKRQLLNHWQDALAMVPFFRTEQTKAWDVLSDVSDKSNLVNAMTADEWLASQR